MKKEIGVQFFPSNTTALAEFGLVQALVACA